MPSGYFNDGTVSVEIGEHAFATPTPARRNILLECYFQPAFIHDSGGGVMDVQVTGQRLRANCGDAERYIYELFCALARSGAGDLGVEDNRGFRAVFGDSICVSASGDVRAFRFADMSFSFLSPERSAQPAWGAVPAAPGEYAGTSWLQDYTAGGVPLGVGGLMRIEMIRAGALREIPRARGARASEPYSGAHIRFIVTAHQLSETANLAEDLDGLARAIGPRYMDLVANGNTYHDVLLDSIRPVHTDMKATAYEIEFIQAVTAGE